MSVKQLAGLIKKDSADIKKAGDELVEEHKELKSGVQIIKNGSKYQMVSSPENSKLVSDFINDETTGELSRPSLETLTIIAYRGPIAKLELDRIRGVNCSLILRNLLLRGLVEVKYRKEDEEPIYSVTLDFVRFLGINDVNELPDYERLSRDDLIDRILAEEEEAANKKKDQKTPQPNKNEAESVKEDPADKDSKQIEKDIEQNEDEPPANEEAINAQEGESKIKPDENSGKSD